MLEQTMDRTLRWRPLTVDEDRWVRRTIASLDTSGKIAQLFNFGVNDDASDLTSLTGTQAGAFHRFPGQDLSRAQAISRRLIESAVVPPLLSGDIEGGEAGFGFASPLLNQLGMAACNDPDLTAELAGIAAREAASIGCNWSFAPVVDISAAFRSTVVGTRSFGAFPDRVLAQAQAHVTGTQNAGLAATAKHWPGEGFDDRDQHLVTTVNPLDMERWRATFGHIFRTLIDGGIMAIMAGHIALPAYHAERGVPRGRSHFTPASVSSRLNTDLLRGELGFKGLLISDATVMGGLTSWMTREEAVPAVIENGCDMFLFSRDPLGDIALMEQGLRNGRLSERRLEEAVTRVLQLKALLGLHLMSVEDRIEAMNCAAEQLCSNRSAGLVRAAAARSLTLVRDQANLLPISVSHHRRVVIASEEADCVFIDGARPRTFAPLAAALRQAGFDVRAYDKDALPTPADTDLLIYAVGHESKPVIGSDRIDWVQLHGSAKRAMIRHRDIPVIVLAFGHPYLLKDAPWATAFVNAYSGIEPIQLELVKALTGAVPLPGNSPVDAFCGLSQLWDATEGCEPSCTARD